jgi:hypothetical protein
MKRILLVPAVLLASVLSASAMSLESAAKAKFELKGYVYPVYSAIEKSTDTLTMKGVRLDLQSQVPDAPAFRWRVQVDPTRAPSLIDAYLEYGKKDLLPAVALKARGGQQKRPFSVESLMSITKIELINRSVAVNTLTPGRDVKGPGGRDLGGTAELAFSPGRKKDLLVGTVGVFNGEGGGVADKNDQKDVDGRLTFKPFEFLSLGGSYSNGTLGAANAVKDRTGAELVFQYGPFGVRGEYLYAKDAAKRSSGGYVLGSVNIWKESVQVVARYDVFDPNRLVAGDRTRVTVAGLNLFASPSTRFIVNHEFKNEQGAKVDNDQTLVAALFMF